MRVAVLSKTALGSLFCLLLTMATFLHADAPVDGLSDLQGNPQRLEDHLGKGKWTVVMIWASDCHVCNAEAHQYVDFQEKYKDGHIRMLGITMDGQSNIEAAKAFVTEHKLNFDNLIGEPETVAGLYYDMTGNFFVGTPTFMIFSPDGQVRAADAGAFPPKILEDFINSQDVANRE